MSDVERVEIKLNFICDGRVIEAPEQAISCGRRICVEYVGWLPIIVECPQCHTRHWIGGLRVDRP